MGSRGWDVHSMAGGGGPGSSTDMNMVQQNQQPEVGHCLAPRPQGTSMDRAAISVWFPPPWKSTGRPLVGRRGLQARESADGPSSFSPSKSYLLIQDNSLIRAEHPVSWRQPLNTSD